MFEFVSLCLFPVDEHASCSVCWDEFDQSVTAVQLPCLHLYHTDCIVPWLKQVSAFAFRSGWVLAEEVQFAVILKFTVVLTSSSAIRLYLLECGTIFGTRFGLRLSSAVADEVRTSLFGSRL